MGCSYVLAIKLSYKYSRIYVWKELFYFATHSTHFIYGYMASDIWLRTIRIAREKTCCHHYMGYSFQLAATTSWLKQGIFYMHHLTDRIGHTMVFVTPFVH